MLTNLRVVTWEDSSHVIHMVLTHHYKMVAPQRGYRTLNVKSGKWEMQKKNMLGRGQALTAFDRHVVMFSACKLGQ
jgi:hypothetical protein